ncbi:helix-hairpin-helix domain-containing protein [Aquimarina sp. AU474]|uniref:ComEA family DNA-binding protein n=1 Tax=Aquimarina sp. AU474 TaxID=2108529 RepID=UPI001359389A|nr:helix-hairpin-helix domain-containing protein [Aquimarina sp. AU474]
MYYFYPDSVIGQKENLVELVEFQKQIDSLKKVASSKKTINTLKPFNPNFINDYKGYILGLSAVELDRLYAYRNKDKWINSVADFKQVTMVSDSLLQIIAPLFKFPDWVTSKTRKTSKNRYAVKTYAEKGDLNTVTALELREQINIPDFIAERIINYKDKIGGFVGESQLKDIKGLYDNQRKKIVSLYTVKTENTYQKIAINTASANELIEVPYFDFEMALAIRDFIKDNGHISSFEELGKIDGFSLEKIDRIALYLTLN